MGGELQIRGSVCGGRELKESLGAGERTGDKGKSEKRVVKGCRVGCGVRIKNSNQEKA